MTALLPGGLSWRRPALDDADSIFALVARHNVSLVGFADYTLGEVRDDLVRPGVDLARDAWIVEEGPGVLVGYGWAEGNGDSDLVDVDVVADDGAVADWLWAQVLGRGAELGRLAGHGTVRVDIGIYQTDSAQHARARARGFEPATTFQRMRIDFEGPPSEPVVADGVVVQLGPGDEDFRRQAHDVSKRAFAEHYGFVGKSFETWHRAIESSESTDWAQLRVAYVDGAPVAMVRGTDQFVDDGNCGYVATVAVLPEARGRGLAKLLLRQAFADDFRRGRRGTILHVDANNVTPAVDLYLSVGMRPVLAIDVWRGLVPTG